VDPWQFASKGRNTPLEGQSLRGVIVTTLYGGNVVYALEPSGSLT
jgi:dihydroorotase-like cyclic amidohydrolase